MLNDRQRYSVEYKINEWKSRTQTHLSHETFETQLTKEATLIIPPFRYGRLVEHLIITMMVGSESRISALAAHLNINIQAGNAAELIAKIWNANLKDGEKHFYAQIFTPLMYRGDAELRRMERLHLFVVVILLALPHLTFENYHKLKTEAEEIVCNGARASGEEEMLKRIAKNLEVYEYGDYVQVGALTSEDELCNGSSI